MINKDFREEKKKILLTGARSACALELARHLFFAGHEVYAADTSTMHVARFSKAVKRFYATPSPRFACREFIDKIIEVVKKEEIDLVIPIWEEVGYLSKYLDKFRGLCDVFCAPFEVIHSLHNKWLFTKKLQEFGIIAPHTVLIFNREQLKHINFSRPYVLKAVYSRGGRKVHIVDSSTPPKIEIQEGNPWIAQEFIKGTHYCSYSVCQSGRLLAHATYPVQYTMDGKSCIAFEETRHDGIRLWIKNFVSKIEYTGQIAFDFIEKSDGSLYAIECNPRATSGMHLFKLEDRLDKAFLNQTTSTIIPRSGNTQQIALGMLMYGVCNGVSEGKVLRYLRKLFTTKDVVFSFSDLKPFLMEPAVLFSYWIKSRKQNLSLPLLFTHDLDWDNG